MTVRWPTPYDLATGLVTGVAPPDAAQEGPLCVVPTLLSPLAALEAAVLPALRRPPCLVSFSGGLDSSVVLAVAVRVARREGLPDPVPVTWRFTGAPRAYESPWQDEIIRVLDVGRDWQILTADDDLDLVGPVARRFLHRFGVLHPLNLHLHLPIVELAAGGSLLTGVGGDQILAGWRRPAPASLLERAGRLRAVVRRRRPATVVFPWLRPAAARHVRRAFLAEERAEPERLDERVAWHLRRRDLRTSVACFTRVADAHDVRLVQPLLDSVFAGALTGWAGHRRRPTRAELLAGIAAGELPASVTAPRRKAHFLAVFLRRPTREFVRHWDGHGIDEDVVDAAALRKVWSRWPIPECTAGLVQDLWLRQNPPASSPWPTPRMEVSP
ncbi:asparagine synthase-related protein [Micromonospora sp. NPDC023633]|uniref:asparagine synthase-related protein n=1 Tax=Micromonospora sp. NPDC023633 TaxID=3154320 RepID=UPI0034105EFE